MIPKKLVPKTFVSKTAVVPSGPRRTFTPKVMGESTERPAESLLGPSEVMAGEVVGLPGETALLLAEIIQPVPGSKEEQNADWECLGYWRHRSSGGPAGGSIAWTSSKPVFPLPPRMWIGENTPVAQSKNPGGLAVWCFIADESTIDEDKREVTWKGKVIGSLNSEQVRAMQATHPLWKEATT